jgi:hypothetical protein
MAQKQINIRILEDAADILLYKRTKDKLFAALRTVCDKQGMVVIIDVDEPTGEEGTESKS